MLQTLISSGFTQREAEMYVLIGLNKPQNATSIRNTLKLSKRSVYRILKKFRNMGIAKATGNRPVYYTVVPFNDLLDLLINANIKQADTLQARKSEILSLWHTTLTR